MAAFLEDGRRIVGDLARCAAIARFFARRPGAPGIDKCSADGGLSLAVVPGANGGRLQSGLQMENTLGAK